VLFAFWGAEELGLLGSDHFVMSLAEEQKSQIALNLNFDMLVRQLQWWMVLYSEKIWQDFFWVIW